MADNRFNQVPGYVGGGFQVAPQNAGIMPGMSPYMQPGLQMNPMMQQHMMLRPGIRYPMQGMRMGPPNTPPPPYATTHSPGLGNFPNRPRSSLSKSKGGQLSEKDRFYEEQRQKLKQIGRPGAATVDTDKLIGAMFGPDTQRSKAPHVMPKEEEDDGFGDFLQGPAIQESEQVEASKTPELTEPTEENDTPPVVEKKDLTSMMMECSDLSAPQKAKGFHKPTLNEVQKTHQGHHHPKSSGSSFHESDHSRSWKQATDLEGLFQLPVPTPVPMSSQPVPVAQVHAHQVTYFHPEVGGVDSTFPDPGSAALAQPVGPPPSYSDVTAGPIPVASATPMVNSHATDPADHQHPSGPRHEPGHPPVPLPDWCLLSVEEVPAVYKHVWEASLVDNKISTERVYPILLLSNLPREKLAHIWSLCNTSIPGQLVKHELWMVLALIALTQNNYSTTSVDILARCPVPPVPFFASAPVPEANSPAMLPTEPQAQHPPPNLAVHSLDNPRIQPPHSLSEKNDRLHSIKKPVSSTGTIGIHSAGTHPNSRGDADEDFADFQTAAPPKASLQVNTFAKDEAFGEFIGGGASTGSGSFSLTDRAPAPSNCQCGNDALVIGNGYLPCHQYPHHQQKPLALQQQQLQQQHFHPNPSPLPTLVTGEDKYNNNIRSFFCSSDSSTGHTSPSFEDDDFTDGRDSLSQVSTSEQSENEDIRNFENYVEEFNREKRVPDGSPLHCPFPSVHNGENKGDKEPPAPLTLSDTGKWPALGTSTSLAFPAVTSVAVSLPTVMSTPGIMSHHQSLNSLKIPPEFADVEFDSFKSAPNSSISGLVVTPVANDDFADFKSASPLATDAAASLPTASEGDVLLISDEDKYDALRFSLDTPQPSLFAQSESSNPGTTGLESGVSVASENIEDDGWADFTLATPTSSELSETAPPSTAQANSKESILKLFSSSSSGQLESGLGLNRGSFNEGNTAGSHGTGDCHASESPSSGAAEDDWAGFSGAHDQGPTTTPVTLADSAYHTPHVVTSPAVSSWQQPSQTVPEDDWCDFAKAGTVAAEKDEGGIDEAEANMVTIKKQNLATKEILGLFKVRDDPTTLSSYQLPAQPPSQTGTRHSRGSRSSGGAHAHRMSSDFDEDMAPPPMDFSHEEDEDDLTFVRGYDLDDVIQTAPPTTSYSPFGLTMSSAVYSRTSTTKNKMKENIEDSGSVHSLELPSARSADLYGTDSQSVSSADMTSSETAGGDFAVVSAESKSLDSLDLNKSCGQDSEGDVGRQDDSSPAPVHHPIRPEELLASMPDFADRYNIERDAQGSDRYSHEWDRCLSNCCRVISEANTIFNTISSSCVCNEVLKSSRGMEYVTGVIEIYRVVCRVMTSMRSTAISSTSLEKTLKDIDLAWNNLTAFLVGASLLPEPSSLQFTADTLKCNSEQSQQMACGLCLLSVDTNNTSLSSSLSSSSSSSSSFGTGSNNKLTYAGRQYHSTCANFWVNCVDHTLPSLTVSGLL